MNQETHITLVQEVERGALLILIEPDAERGLDQLFRLLGYWEPSRIHIDPLVGQLYTYWRHGVTSVPVFEGEVVAAPLYGGAYAPSAVWALPAVLDRLAPQQGAVVALPSAAEASTFLAALRKLAAFRRVVVAEIEGDGLRQLDLQGVLAAAPAPLPVLSDSDGVPAPKGDERKELRISDLSYRGLLARGIPTGSQGRFQIRESERWLNDFGDEVNALGRYAKFNNERAPRVIAVVGGTKSALREFVAATVVPSCLALDEGWNTGTVFGVEGSLPELFDPEDPLKFTTVQTEVIPYKRVDPSNPLERYHADGHIFVVAGDKTGLTFLRMVDTRRSIVVLWFETKKEAARILNAKKSSPDVIARTEVYLSLPPHAGYVWQGLLTHFLKSSFFAGFGEAGPYDSEKVKDTKLSTEYLSPAHALVHADGGFSDWVRIEAESDNESWYSHIAALDLAEATLRRGSFSVIAGVSVSAFVQKFAALRKVFTPVDAEDRRRIKGSEAYKRLNSDGRGRLQYLGYNTVLWRVGEGVTDREHQFISLLLSNKVSVIAWVKTPLSLGRLLYTNYSERYTHGALSLRLLFQPDEDTGLRRTFIPEVCVHLESDASLDLEYTQLLEAVTK